MGDLAGDVPSHETSGAGAGSRHGEYACVARADLASARACVARERAVGWSHSAVAPGGL